MKKKQTTTAAPRNFVAIAAMKRTGGGAGAHGKSGKADRRASKMALSRGKW